MSDSDDLGKKSFFKTKPKIENKQRLMVTSSGTTSRFRHLMNDLISLLPHAKKEGKCQIDELNELAELNNCNNTLYFQVKKKQDLFVWLSKTPTGPSVKFICKTLNTIDELKLSGNCLKGSRPVLSFDSTFDSEPHLMLIKELLTQVCLINIRHLEFRRPREESNHLLIMSCLFPLLTSVFGSETTKSSKTLPLIHKKRKKLIQFPCLK